MWPLSYNYIERIATLARTLTLNKYENDYGNPNPIDLNEDIKTSMGIQILYTDTDAFNGCLMWDDKLGRPKIIVARKDRSSRQEFTISHEIGHLLLHWEWLPNEGLKTDAQKYVSTQHNMLDVVPLYRGKKRNKEDPKEFQANEFASDFLMPYKGVRSIYLSEYNPHLSDVVNADKCKRAISQFFNPLVVSKGAAYERIRNMQNNGELISDDN